MNDLQRSFTFHAPVKGLLEGRDPALPDDRYSPAFAPELENFRVQQGRWAVRLGLRASDTITGTGRTKYLGSIYLRDAHATPGSRVARRIRIAARGALGSLVLYKIEVGVDSNFTSLVTGLGSATVDEPLQGVTVRNAWYYTDRAGVLRKISYVVTTLTGATVAPLAKPASAPSVTPGFWGYLEPWIGTEPFGWTESNAAVFRLREADDEKTDVDDAGNLGNAVRISTEDNAKGETIRQNTFAQPVESFSIAFQFQTQNTVKPLWTFDIGLQGAGDFHFQIDPPNRDKVYPKFLPIGNIATINFKRFRCRMNLDATGVARLFLSPLILPGRLQGKYRYRYSYYDTVTLDEGSMSDATAVQDFSMVGTDYRSDSWSGGSNKVALLRFTTFGALSAQSIRIYRSGGVSSLTQDANGQEIWVRVGQVIDLSTTLNGAVTAGAGNLTLTSIANTATPPVSLAAGDWLVLEPGTPGAEEFVRIADYNYSDLRTVTNNTQVTSDRRPFIAADAGRTLTVYKGGGFNAATVTISSVLAGVATVSGSVGTHPATAGSAALGAVNTSNKNLLVGWGPIYAHDSGAAAACAFGDNVANDTAAALLPTNRTMPERDGPPRGAQWIAKAPDGRIYLANFLEDRDNDGVFEYTRKLGVAVSNMPTPDHPNDHEIFPYGVDPLTRRNPIQGLRFDVGSDTQAGDEITWAGFFNEVYTIFTRRECYQVSAQNQTQWGPNAVVKRLDRGCLAGKTVQILNGALYWVADGPCVLRWDGQGAPEDLSYLRISETLRDAPEGNPDTTNILQNDPTQYWRRWFALAHADENNIYYRLCIVPSEHVYDDLKIDAATNTNVTSRKRPFTSADVGKTVSVTGGTGFTRQDYTISSVAANVATLSAPVGTVASTGGQAKLHKAFPSLWLDYNVVGDCWEPRVHYRDGGSDGIGDVPILWECAEVRDGPQDDRNLFAAVYDTTTGSVWEMEQGKLDGTIPIKAHAKTKRQALPGLFQLERFYLRLDRTLGECDTFKVTARMGGSEYGDTDRAYPIAMEGETDAQFRQRVHPGELKGRWLEFEIDGDTEYLPALREIEAVVSFLRDDQVVP